MGRRLFGLGRWREKKKIPELCKRQSYRSSKIKISLTLALVAPYSGIHGWTNAFPNGCISKLIYFFGPENASKTRNTDHVKDNNADTSFYV